MEKLKFIDLFAGIGGFRLAMESLGLECVFSSEIDESCKKVYSDNFGSIPYGDITQIDEKKIPDFDILAAGFPCQPFSYAGKLEGFEDKTRGTLFFDIIRIMKEKKPKMFILENVKGLKSHNNGDTLKTIQEQLEQLGYTIYWTILNSNNFGLPQQRERWFCVGFDKNIYFEFPKSTNNNKKLRDIVDIENNDPALKLSEFELDRIKHHFKNCPAHSENQLRVNHDNSKYEKNTKKGKYGIYSFLKPDKNLRFHVGDYSKTQIQEAFYCNLDGISPTIIAARAPKLWDLERHLSILECKRLQGFPDSFKINVSNTQAKKQLGNSVSIPVIKAIIENMLNFYKNEVDYQNQGYNQLKIEI